MRRAVRRVLPHSEVKKSKIDRTDERTKNDRARDRRKPKMSTEGRHLHRWQRAGDRHNLISHRIQSMHVTSGRQHAGAVSKQIACHHPPHPGPSSWSSSSSSHGRRRKTQHETFTSIKRLSPTIVNTVRCNEDPNNHCSPYHPLSIHLSAMTSLRF